MLNETCSIQTVRCTADKALVSAMQVGMETFRMCRGLLDGVILVDNSAISAAIKDVFNETRSILEPAGAVAVAGAKAYLSRQGLQVITGRKVLVVVSSSGRSDHGHPNAAPCREKIVSLQVKANKTPLTSCVMPRRACQLSL